MDTSYQSMPNGLPPVTNCASHLKLHEILDHALFGPKNLSQTPFFDNFPVQTVVHPEIDASGLPGVSGYHRVIISNNLRQSTRNHPPQPICAESEPDFPDSVSPVVLSPSASDADSDSDWETMFEPGPRMDNVAQARDFHAQA
jgi:hypothetical protein